MVEIIAFLSSITTLLMAIPYVKDLIGYYRRNRIAQVFWDAPTNDYLIIHSAYTDNKYKTKQHYYLKSETVIAIRHIESFLASINKKVTLKRCTDEFSKEELKANIIILGSSRTNSVVKKYFEVLEKLFYFRYDKTSGEYFIQNHETGVKLISSLTKDDSADFALIVKIPNPYQPNNRVLYIAGVHAYGTLAATHYLTNLTNIKRLPKHSLREALVGVVWAKFSEINIVQVREEHPLRVVNWQEHSK